VSILSLTLLWVENCLVSIHLIKAFVLSSNEIINFLLNLAPFPWFEYKPFVQKVQKC
jgi:hypothetical protein